MKPAIRPPKKKYLDQVGIEALEEMRQSRGWNILKGRADTVRLVLLDQLMQPKDPVETATLRGRIDGFRMALSIPDILISEAKERHGKTKRSGPQEDPDE